MSNDEINIKNLYPDSERPVYEGKHPYHMTKRLYQKFCFFFQYDVLPKWYEAGNKKGTFPDRQWLIDNGFGDFVGGIENGSLGGLGIGDLGGFINSPGINPKPKGLESLIK